MRFSTSDQICFHQRSCQHAASAQAISHRHSRLRCPYLRHFSLMHRICGACLLLFMQLHQPLCLRALARSMLGGLRRLLSRSNTALLHVHRFSIEVFGALLCLHGG